MSMLTIAEIAERLLATTSPPIFLSPAKDDSAVILLHRDSLALICRLSSHAIPPSSNCHFFFHQGPLHTHEFSSRLSYGPGDNQSLLYMLVQKNHRCTA